MAHIKLDPDLRKLPDPVAEPTITIARAGAILGIGRATAYEAADRGDLPTVPVGSRRVVLTYEFLKAYRLLDALTATTALQPAGPDVVART